MRTINRKALALALAALGWLAGTRAGWADVEIPLVFMTNVWTYHDLGTNPPVDPTWKAADFDDSTWKTGRALFGEETPGVLPLPILTPIPAPGHGGPLTTYFRTRFQYPSNSPLALTLVSSNLVDDGAVYYINGQEAGRLRVSATTVTYSTLATSAPEPEGRVEPLSLAVTNVRPGENVLAVELHQYTVGSADAVFGVGLTASWPDPIVITNPPASQTVAVGTPATFQVGISGSSPVFRWYKAGSAGVLSTGNSYTIASPSLVSAGDYYVVVSNTLNVVTSSVATLTVVEDVYGPGIVSAVAQATGASNTVRVTFTENLAARSATNTENYLLAVTGTTDAVTITRAQPFQNQVVLTVGGPKWIWGGQYLLTVTNVTDPRSNFVSPPSNMVYVVFPQEWLPMSGLSLYWDWITASLYRVPAADFPANWNSPDLDDRDAELWTPVQGVAHYAWYPACDTLRSQLASTRDRITHYFRTRFTLPPNAGVGELTFNYVVGDGAVFYLNGQEFGRVNMYSGQVRPETLAITRATSCSSTTLPTSALRTGDNVLAVEVHRAPTSENYRGVYYGVQITGWVAPEPPIQGSSR